MNNLSTDNPHEEKQDKFSLMEINLNGSLRLVDAPNGQISAEKVERAVLEHLRNSLSRMSIPGLGQVQFENLELWADHGCVSVGGLSFTVVHDNENGCSSAGVVLRGKGKNNKNAFVKTQVTDESVALLARNPISGADELKACIAFEGDDLLLMLPASGGAMSKDIALEMNDFRSTTQ